MNRNDPRWSDATKRIVAVALLVLAALVIYNFRIVIPPLVIAFLLAFIIKPIVDFLSETVHLNRGVATTLVFLILVVGMLGVVAAPVSLVPQIQATVESLRADITRIINDISTFLSQPVEIWEYELDLSGLSEELSSMLRSFVTNVAEGTVDFAFQVASGAFWLIFILMASFYMVKDADRLTKRIDRLAPPGYREDVRRLRQRIGRVWNAFLRGQLILGLLMVIITTLIAMGIGLPYPIVMGLLAGLMEFVPSVGPFIAGIPAVLVALFQGSNFLPLNNFWFAVLVAAIYVIIQQIEGNLLLPRILGGSLDLHPLLVLIAIIFGGTLAGILGMLLAAPVLATLRVLGRYIFCRMYDLDPFAEPEEEAEEQEEPARGPGFFKRVVEFIADWARRVWRRVRQAWSDLRGAGSGGEDE